MAHNMGSLPQLMSHLFFDQSLFATFLDLFFGGAPVGVVGREILDLQPAFSLHCTGHADVDAYYRLWSVLSVMTPEAMRTLNSALDESGRAVWKALYADWKRVGRGR